MFFSIAQVHLFIDKHVQQIGIDVAILLVDTSIGPQLFPSKDLQLLTGISAQAAAACKTQQGPLNDFTLSKEELYELKVAALLHDCGKVITPVHIVDKATKLENIFDRIHLIDTRFEVLKRDAEILYRTLC